MKKYIKEEVKQIEQSTTDLDFDWGMLPIWTKIKWAFIGPPQSAGPR